MRIANASLSLDAQHTSQQTWELREGLNIRTGQAATAADIGRSAPLGTSESSLVVISSAGNALQSSEANAVKQGLVAAERDPILQLLRKLIALLTGEEPRVFESSALDSTASATEAAPPAASDSRWRARIPEGLNLEYARSESYTEIELTEFNASGSIRTADGKTLQFSLALQMSRYYHEESSTRLQIGNAARTRDPLVLNFAGTAAQLSSQRFQFDLDADGQDESINFTAPGSGFLAIDRNGDGVINDGGELFGTQSGNGFADLMRLDADHNGWIDESDPAYAQLRVWTQDASGTTALDTLQQAGVGALSLASGATPFSLKDTNNALLGQIVASGVFLNENGSVGTLQQVDLTV